MPLVGAIQSLDNTTLICKPSNDSTITSFHSSAISSQVVPLNITSLSILPTVLFVILFLESMLTLSILLVGALSKTFLFAFAKTTIPINNRQDITDTKNIIPALLIIFAIIKPPFFTLHRISISMYKIEDFRESFLKFL